MRPAHKSHARKMFIFIYFATVIARDKKKVAISVITERISVQYNHITVYT